MREASSWSGRGAPQSSEHGLRGRSCPLLALVLFTLLAPLPRAEAFPIAPQTLKELTQGAELVVWAEVEKVTVLPPPEPGAKPREGDWDKGLVAHLRIREVWRGKAPADERIQVHYAQLTCPAGAIYDPDERVLAFLVQREGRWRTVGLSYGTRYPTDEDEVAAYRHAVTRFRVMEEQAIVARAARREDGVTAALTDWQVLLATHPATRWDGLYGLVPDSDADHFFYDYRPFRAVHLLPEQREQLTRGFVKYPPLDRTLPMLLTALRGHKSDEVDRLSARALETVLADERPPRWADRAFDLLRERYGEQPAAPSKQDEDPLMRTMADAKAGPSGPRVSEGSPLLREWRRFKQRHHLKPKPLPLPVEFPAPGTGGNTTL
ncbi:MAG: hypothetical protein EOO71_32070 [Myxococcaceae bacterium]|nr:MAG: hypothetical protein EOO71_32070 [Myxococcaceae bacterium]